MGRTPSSNPGAKVTLYFPTELIEEIEREADRLDRSVGWVVKRAWELAKADVRQFPAPDENE